MAKLKNNHFIDDTDEVLKAIWNEKKTCKIRRNGGTLFHFMRSGLGEDPPEPET